MSRIGLELTFLPNCRGPLKEFLRRRDAVKAAAELSRRLHRDERVKTFASHIGLPRGKRVFNPRADVFRLDTAWCIEVGNVPFEAGALVDYPVGPTASALQAVYDHAAALRLHPHIERRQRDGTILDWPTGGGHIHVGIQLWQGGDTFLLQLHALEQAMCIAYANHPWIRWLFAQWSDDYNSSIAVPRQSIDAIHTLKPEAMRSKVHDKALWSSSIYQRFAGGSKARYPTYEFRFIDMPRNVNELRLQVQFIACWMGYYKRKVDELFAAVDLTAALPQWYKDYATFTLTAERFDRLTTDLAYAKAEAHAYLTLIGVDADAVLAAFWERGYVRRHAAGNWA
jgi:hypothetical protein